MSLIKTCNTCNEKKCLDQSGRCPYSHVLGCGKNYESKGCLSQKNCPGKRVGYCVSKYNLEKEAPLPKQKVLSEKKEVF